MAGILRLSVMLALLCSACMSDRDIRTYSNPDQVRIVKLSGQDLAFADIKTTDGHSYLGTTLVAFKDGACVSAAHPCVEIGHIQSIRVGQDKLAAVDPATAVLGLALAVAVTSSLDGPRDYRKARKTLEFEESPTAWIDLDTNRTAPIIMWLSKDRFGFRDFLDEKISCGWESLPVSDKLISNDREAATFLLAIKQKLPGSCLLASTDLIAHYDPNEAIAYWMLGAVRVRSERLQCKNAAIQLNPRQYRKLTEHMDLEPAVVADFGFVSPSGFLLWSRQTAKEARSILGDFLAEFEEDFTKLIADQVTFAYDPHLDEICANAGGVASEEVRDLRLDYLSKFAPFHDAEPRLFIGNDIIVGGSEIEERLEQMKGES